MKKCTLILLILISTVLLSESLWNKGGMNLLSVKKASDVGDIVKVMVYEIPVASTKLKDGNIFSAVFDFISGIFTGFTTGNLADFVPIGDVPDTKKRENEISAKVLLTISATVIGKDEYGNLIIKGRKIIKVGSEKKLMEISGKVRPEDVGPDNTVDSRDMAEAQIWVDGDIVYKNSQEEPDSWISYILSSIADIFM